MNILVKLVKMIYVILNYLEMIEHVEFDFTIISWTIRNRWPSTKMLCVQVPLEANIYTVKYILNWPFFFQMFQTETKSNPTNLAFVRFVLCQNTFIETIFCQMVMKWCNLLDIFLVTRFQLCNLALHVLVLDSQLIHIQRQT